MALVKLRRAAQISLPTEIRKQLEIAEGDYLEAEVIRGKVVLRPVSAPEHQKAWRKIREAQRSVRNVGPEP